jgi:hypothetical protein
MLSIHDFAANSELFHRALRVIKAFLEEENAMEEDISLEGEIAHLDDLLNGLAQPIGEKEMGDALVVTGDDPEEMLVFFIMYRDPDLAGKLYEAYREMLYLNERGYTRDTFVDEVMNVFDPSISDDEAEQRYYELRFEGMDMDHICLHRDESIYVGVAALEDDEEDEEAG